MGHTLISDHMQKKDVQTFYLKFAHWTTRYIQDKYTHAQMHTYVHIKIHVPI